MRKKKVDIKVDVEVYIARRNEAHFSRESLDDL
jgi:hypothetical protein